jgi:hypothetical protein
MGLECKKEEKKLDMMISGGDYSPNSHTFFKHPFNKELENDQAQDSKIVTLNKCPK